MNFDHAEAIIKNLLQQIPADLFGASNHLLMPILLGIAVILGISNCFFGYKFRHFWFCVACVIFGAGLSCWLFYEKEYHIAICFAVGYFAAILLGTVFYKIAEVSLIFAASYYVLSYVPWLSAVPVLVISAGLAVAAFFMERWVCSVVTSVAGSFIAFSFFGRLYPFAEQYVSGAYLKTLWEHIYRQGRFFVPAVLLMAAVGFVVQADVFGRRPLFSVSGKKKNSSADSQKEKTPEGIAEQQETPPAETKE